MRNKTTHHEIKENLTKIDYVMYLEKFNQNVLKNLFNSKKEIKM